MDSPNKSKFRWSLKVRKIRSGFFKLMFPPKNEHLTLLKTNSFVHFEDSRIRGYQKVLSKLTDLYTYKKNSKVPKNYTYLNKHTVLRGFENSDKRANKYILPLFEGRYISISKGPCKLVIIPSWISCVILLWKSLLKNRCPVRLLGTTE